jgi:hypothetical protein
MIKRERCIYKESYYADRKASDITLYAARRQRVTCHTGSWQIPDGQ